MASHFLKFPNKGRYKTTSGAGAAKPNQTGQSIVRRSTERTSSARANTKTRTGLKQWLISIPETPSPIPEIPSRRLRPSRADCQLTITTPKNPSTNAYGRASAAYAINGDNQSDNIA